MTKIRVKDFQKGKKDIVPEATSTGRKRTMGRDPLLAKPFEEKGKGGINYSERPVRATAKRSRDYYDRVKYPTYSQFDKPEAMDEYGRQYRAGDGEDFENMILTGEMKRGNPFDSLQEKKTLLYIRLNKGASFITGPPRMASKISVIHIRSGKLYSGHVESIEGFGRGSSTGSAVISKWKLEGQSSTALYGSSMEQLPKKYQRTYPSTETSTTTT